MVNNSFEFYRKRLIETISIINETNSIPTATNHYVSETKSSRTETNTKRVRFEIDKSTHTLVMGY